MMKSLLPAIIAAGLFGNCLFAQGLDTRAKPTDWEEINFEFNSPVLTDGYPSLLRLADLLKAHPDYKVRIVGNADSIGSNAYNDRLSVARANTVAQFLQKYGASAGQIQATGEGKRNPEVSNRNKLGRWINRRVVMTLTDANGNVISDGPSVAKIINDFEEYARRQLSKLDQLNDIMNQLRDLQSKVAALQSGEDAILSSTKEIKSDTTELVRRPSPLTYEQTDEIAHRAADYALTQSALRNRKYALVGGNYGPTFMPGRTGDVSGSLYGKFLVPFGNGKTPDMPGTQAVQFDGEWLYWPYREEGLFDAGLVKRFGHVQAGAFAEFLHANIRSYHGGATVGQGAFTLDYLFGDGKIGLFAGKAFKDDAIITKANLAGGPAPAYIKTEDQIGFSATLGLWGDSYLESSLAYKKRFVRALQDKPSAMLRVVIPINDQFAITAEGSVNETFQNLSDAGRVVFGFEWGNFLRPKHYFDTTAPIPAYVPRIHYEVLQR